MTSNLPLAFIARARVLAKRDDRPVHQAADKFMKPLTLAAMAALNLGKKALGKPPDADRAAAAVEKALSKTMPPLLEKMFLAGVKIGIGSLKTAEGLRTLRPQFDISNKRAAQWAKEHGAQLVKDVGDTTRSLINDAVARAFELGTLEEQYDDILAAIGDETRASLIARTESMTAVSEGNREGWLQASQNGLLDGGSKREWIATSGACPLCLALDGKKTTLDGTYPGGGGNGPPRHPRCRCTEGIAA